MAQPRADGGTVARVLTILIVALATSPVTGTIAWSKTSDQNACLTATEHAARATGAPLMVLRALALTESGQRRAGRYAPWPWTVNMQGKGLWFDTPDQALAYIHRHYRDGARSFDVGCFQINHKWHGNAFASIDAMLDPTTNALYAAKFLTQLYRETGDWSAAAGIYHSRTPEKSRRYRSRFDALLAQLRAQEPAPPQNPRATPAIRPNRYPLLQVSETSRGMGSLVPRPAGKRLFDKATPTQ